MHVTLLNPPTIATVTTMAQEAVPPLGLAYVCAATRAHGFEVTVVDAVGEALEELTIYSRERRSLLRGLAFDAIVARIPRHTRVIGVTCMFSNAWCPTRDLLLRIREARPDAVLVLGGEHATACWELILRTCPAVDFCVLGEGEETFPALLHCLAEGGDPRAVAGIAYREGGAAVRAGAALITPRRKRIPDIDAIARPAWDAFPLEAYIAGRYNHGVHRGRSMPILASRGCPYRCTFCSSPNMWTTRWRARDPRDVLDEMKGYVDQYRVNDFAFYDLTAIIDRAWIVRFARMLIEERLDVTWQLPSGTRSEAIDGEVARLLHASGCRNMNYAPESGSPAVLARIKKRVKLDRMIDSIRAATAEGIAVKVNIILGFPDETPAEVLETYAFIARLARLGVEAVSVFPFCAYPGSELYDDLVRRGALTPDDDYFHELVFTDYGRVVSYSRYFSARELSALVVGANAIFYGISAAAQPRRALALAMEILARRQESKVANAVGPMRARQEAYARLANGAIR
jgi:radical SAM superfamily enzyme YgiQ (UPF0313 family)